MGLFDSVYARCSCGHAIEWQTKAMPDPYLRVFPLEAVPIAAAQHLNGKLQSCPACGKSWVLQPDTDLPATVRMKVVPIP